MSYRLFSITPRTAKKKHHCIWCGQFILPGEAYHDERSVFDNMIQRHRWHPECYEAAQQEFEDGPEFNAWENPRPPKLEQYCDAVIKPCSAFL